MILPLVLFSALNTAFDVPPSEAVDTFNRGMQDANSKRDDSFLLDRFRRGIGSVRTSLFGKKETVSYFWAFPPRVLAYHAGFEARKKYEPSDFVEHLRSSFQSGEGLPKDRIRVEGHIKLEPSRAGRRIVRSANEHDLDDVRVVMKVGDKVYQPVEQPGNMLQKSGTGTIRYKEVDRADSITTTPYAQYQTTTYYSISHSERYKWYAGEFEVDFKLFDGDGTCRVPPSVNEITFVVVYGSNERSAVYKLSDFVTVP